MFQAAPLAMKGSYSDFNQYLRTDLIQNCGNGNWLNLNKRPCWDSIRDPLASEANPWTAGLRYLPDYIPVCVSMYFKFNEQPNRKVSWLDSAHLPQLEGHSFFFFFW